MCFKATAETFPKLHAVSYNTINLDHITSVMSSIQLVQLRELTIGCQAPLAQGTLRNFLEELSTSCPDITSVALCLTRAEEIATTPITFGDLEPMLQCHNIAKFKIIHDLPIEIVWEEDLTRMGKAWPFLHNLKLCPDPHPDHCNPQLGMPIQALAQASIHLFHLEVLSGFLSNDIGQLPVNFALHNLCELNVGFSKVPARDVQKTGVVIGSFCRSFCKIRFGSQWGSLHQPPPWAEEAEGEWRLVEELARIVGDSLVPIWREEDYLRETVEDLQQSTTAIPQAENDKGALALIR